MLKSLFFSGIFRIYTTTLNSAEAQRVIWAYHSMDIREYPEVVDAINAIITNKGVAEIKLEKKDTIVVVETSRQVKNMTPAK